MRALHVVLVHPEIPQNTGNIIRLCFLNEMRLHLIEPLGFSLDDASLRRAGIDYWDRFHAQVEIHENWEAFSARHSDLVNQAWFFSAHASRSFWDIEDSGPEGYGDPACLVFGRETGGLPEGFAERYRDRLTTIPKRSPEGRSLNLSNAVAVAAYEVMRRG